MHRSARPPAGVETLLSEHRPLCGSAMRLPPPAARSEASTAKGEVGGAQHPEGASTDGCLRLAASNSEGAAAEREGFEPSVGF